MLVLKSFNFAVKTTFLQILQNINDINLCKMVLCTLHVIKMKASLGNLSEHSKIYDIMSKDDHKICS